MKMKNFNSYYIRSKELPEKIMEKNIISLSREIEKNEDMAKQWLKKVQREYYLNQLVKLDETIQ